MQDKRAVPSEISFFTTGGLAKYLKVAPSKIRSWVASGQLRAVNVASKPTGRARYRFDPVDVELFLASRRTGGDQSARPPPRRRRTSDVIKFF